MDYTTNSEFMDPTAQEFVHIMKKGTYEQLLQLYYKYKGFYITGSADFVQGVVVQFMEEYCIEIKAKLKNTVHLSMLKDQMITLKSVHLAELFI